MAGKKYEFKPDRTGSGNLGKLYLTKKQRLSLVKWLLYSLVCLVALVLQDVTMSRMRLFGATTDLVAVVMLMICVLEGGEKGGIFTLICSFIYLFSGSAPGTYTMVLLTFLGVFAAIFRQAYLRKGYVATLVCTGTALMVYELATFCVGLLTGVTIPSRFLSFLLTGLYSSVLMPLLYPVLLSIGKIGGETWKE